jgi:ankyrin repeat protein
LTLQAIIGGWSHGWEAELNDLAMVVGELDRRPAAAGDAGSPPGGVAFQVHTALSLACARGQPKCVAALLRAGADAGVRLPATYSVTRDGGLPAVQPDSEPEQTAVHVCCRVGAPDCLARLLAAGADPREVDGAGCTGLDIIRQAADVADRAGEQPAAADLVAMKELLAEAIRLELAAAALGSRGPLCH